ncbi:MAG: hypothetical protein AAFY44_18565, partial [Pseudomonadota bacterium]
NDQLEGDDEANVLSGLDGNDTLRGNGGDDRYLVNLDSGDDVIFETVGHDTLVFGEDISLEDLIVESGNFVGGSRWHDTRISFENGTGSLSIYYSISSHYNGVAPDAPQLIETVEFADGTTYAWNDFLAETLYRGTDGNDVIWGNEGTQDFYSSAGNDVLLGVGGGDRYHIALNHGDDVINDVRGDDTIVFGAGITLDNFIVESGHFYGSSSRHDVRIRFENAEGSVIIYDNLSSPRRGVHDDSSQVMQSVEFFDGTTMSFADFLGQTLYAGTDGADRVWGNSDQQYFRASLGDDFLYGVHGDDIYEIALNHGNDTINDHGGVDTVRFGAG